MTDSRQLPKGKNSQAKTNSKTLRSYFEELDEQFEILYQNAVGKAGGQTIENIASESMVVKNKSCQELQYEAMTREAVQKPVKDITSSPTLSVRERFHTTNRSPLKSRRLSLNYTYPLARKTESSQISPVKSERSSFVSARKETELISECKGKDTTLSFSSKKNSDKDYVSNTENQVDQLISSSPVKSARLSSKPHQSHSNVEASNLSCDKNCNEQTLSKEDSFDAFENDKKLTRIGIPVHDNKIIAISDHVCTSKRNQNMTKPSKLKRPKISQVKHEVGPKSKRFKTHEQCSEVTQSTNTSPVYESDKTIALKKNSRNLANVKRRNVNYQDRKDKEISSGNTSNRKKDGVKQNLAESTPSSTSESESNSQSKGFVYTIEESLNRQGRNNKVHSASTQIASIMDLDEAIPLQSMKSSRVQDRPIWNSILSQFKT